MEKIVIQEIHRIKEMMGLHEQTEINSSEANELLQYGKEYLSGHTCDEIYEDLIIFRDAVTNGKVQLDPKDLQTLNDNIAELKKMVIDSVALVKPAKCALAKGMMRSKFKEESEKNIEKLKVNMCWFAENIDKKQLNACKKTPTSTPQSTQQSNQSSEIKLPITVSGSFNSTNGDEAHNFRELEKKLDELLPQIYAQKINPKMTSVTATIKNNGNNNFTTTYTVIVDKSDDGKAWMGFTARGSFGGGYVQRADGQITGTENEDGKSLKEKLESIGAGEMVDIPGSPIEDKTVPFKEYFKQFTKPKKYPPHKDEIQAQPEVKPQAQAEVKPQAQAEVKPQAQAEVKPQAQQKPTTETQPSGEVYIPKVRAVNSGSYQGDYKPKVVKVGGNQ